MVTSPAFLSHQVDGLDRASAGLFAKKSFNLVESTRSPRLLLGFCLEKSLNFTEINPQSKPFYGPACLLLGPVISSNLGLSGSNSSWHRFLFFSESNFINVIIKQIQIKKYIKPNLLNSTQLALHHKHIKSYVLV